MAAIEADRIRRSPASANAHGTPSLIRPVRARVPFPRIEDLVRRQTLAPCRRCAAILDGPDGLESLETGVDPALSGPAQSSLPCQIKNDNPPQVVPIGPGATSIDRWDRRASLDGLLDEHRGVARSSPEVGPGAAPPQVGSARIRIDPWRRSFPMGCLESRKIHATEFELLRIIQGV
jgi:hypothetical protein